MGQAEYNTFREQMKQWMLDNAETYDQFEELMNSESDQGYQQIMALKATEALRLLKKFLNTITSDNGKGFAKHEQIAQNKTRIQVEFSKE